MGLFRQMLKSKPKRKRERLSRADRRDFRIRRGPYDTLQRCPKRSSQAYQDRMKTIQEDMRKGAGQFVRDGIRPVCKGC